MATKYRTEDILTYSETPPHRSTVRSHYSKWRKKNNLPLRCDNPKCKFYLEPLNWNGNPLTPILDHRNGNRYDNSAENLRYLCPNCDSQQKTRGGRNISRVQNLTKTGYELFDKETGRRDAHAIPPGAKANLEGHAPTAIVKPISRKR